MQNRNEKWNTYAELILKNWIQTSDSIFDSFWLSYDSKN